MKTKMKPGKYTAIFGPLSAVALAVAIAVNPIADSFDVTLNNLGFGLGQGELVVNQIKARGGVEGIHAFYTGKDLVDVPLGGVVVPGDLYQPFVFVVSVRHGLCAL